MAGPRNTAPSEAAVPWSAAYGRGSIARRCRKTARATRSNLSDSCAEKEVCQDAAFAWPEWSSGAEKWHSSARSRLIRLSIPNCLTLRFLLILSLALLWLRLVAGVARVPQCLFVSHVNSFCVRAANHQRPVPRVELLLSGGD